MPTIILVLLAAQSIPFSTTRRGEVVAHLELSASGSEPALARLELDSAQPQTVALWAGSDRQSYSVFLGELASGTHSLSIDNARVHSSRFEETTDAVTSHAPILYARKDADGRFNDVPMVAYCEKRPGNVLEYSVIFSNEDGGTSTRALMARWGRTTDIEFIYRVWLNEPGRAIIQAKDHKEIAFAGKREGLHPVLYVSTRNNMVSAEGDPAMRFQIAPREIDLTAHSREEVMDLNPLTYRAASLELQREAKLRPFGTVDGQKISDPRNYLYIEAKVENRDSALAVLVRLREDSIWRSSSLGHTSYAIERSGWARSAIELPPGTRADQIEEIGFECVVPARSQARVAGKCRVEAVSKAFLLNATHLPAPSFWQLLQPVDIPSGQMRTFRVQRSEK